MQHIPFPSVVLGKSDENLAWPSSVLVPEGEVRSSRDVNSWDPYVDPGFGAEHRDEARPLPTLLVCLSLKLDVVTNDSCRCTERLSVEDLVNEGAAAPKEEGDVA